MLKKFKPFQASGRIEFKDPDTGHIYTAPTTQELHRSIVMYRMQNQLEPIEALPDVVENYMCELGCNVGKCVTVELKRSWSHYIKGGIALVKNMAFRKYCTQEEAEKRAEQCVACVHNIFPDKGPFVSWVDDIAIQQVGERRTKRHNDLGSCAVCTCPLRSKVFVGTPLPGFPESEAQEMRKVKCWQLKLSSQE